MNDAWATSTSGVETSASQGVGELGREVIDKRDLCKAEFDALDQLAPSHGAIR